MEIRKRNFVQAEHFPYTAFSGLVYDSANHWRRAEKAAELADYDGTRAHQQTQNVGRPRRSGSVSACPPTSRCAAWHRPGSSRRSTTAPAAGRPPPSGCCRPTRCRWSPARRPHGQGHETSWSMIVADKLGVPPEDVEVLHSDTAISPIGLDTYGSRSLAVGGVAIDMACDRVIDKARKIAAHQLECAEEDLDFGPRHLRCPGHARLVDATGRRRVRRVHGPRPARRHGAEPRGPRPLRPAELLLALRDPHLRGRGRHRDRRGGRARSTSPSTTAGCRSTR